MEKNGQLHAPATLPLDKAHPCTNCNRSCVDPRTGLDTVEKWQISCSCWKSKHIPLTNQSIAQGCTNSWQQTTFCMVVPNICKSSICKWLYFTLLAPMILTWLLHFWKPWPLLGPFNYMTKKTVFKVMEFRHPIGTYMIRETIQLGCQEMCQIRTMDRAMGLVFI